MQYLYVFALYVCTISWKLYDIPYDTLARRSKKLIETNTSGVSDLPRQIHLVMRRGKSYTNPIEPEISEALFIIGCKLQCSGERFPVCPYL